MILYERQQQIIKYIKVKHFATIKELLNVVYASESSIRRDVKALEIKGYVKQIYGGVVLAEFENRVVPVVLRDNSNSAVKDELAKRAAEELFDGATIIMDGSSTVRRIIKYISKFKDIKIFTNNLQIFSECDMNNVKLYCTGGVFNVQNNILFGEGAETYLNQINADLLFFSSQAISNEGIISDASEEETKIRKIMMSRAKRKIFLCDSSKVGKLMTFSVCSKNDVNKIICDKKLPWDK